MTADEGKSAGVHQTPGLSKTVKMPFSFFMLPRDIRMLVYDNLFANSALLITLRSRKADDKNIEPRSLQAPTVGDFSIRKPLFDLDEQPQKAPNLDLLYVSKTVRAEALPLFYSSFTFSFFQPELYEYFLKALPFLHRIHIRHVALDLGLHWHFHCPPTPSYQSTEYEREIYYTGLPNRPLHHLFTTEAFGKEWDEILLPNLHSIEARMWARVDRDAYPEYLDTNQNMIFGADDDENINYQIAKMKVAKRRLELSHAVRYPRTMLQAKPELTWSLSTGVCQAHNLPTSMYLDLENVEEDLECLPGFRIGIICLNVSLRRLRVVTRRKSHFGGADVVAAMMNETSETYENYEEFRGLTGWG